MNQLKSEETRDNLIKDGPQSTIEKALLEAYLQQRGFHLNEIDSLPEEQARELMTKASQYASLKLAQVESTARFREKIHLKD
jgi:hypothetical protein